MDKDKKVIGIFMCNEPADPADKVDLPMVLHEMRARKSCIDKLVEQEDCVVIGILPTGDLTDENDANTPLTEASKRSILEQVRLCDEVVIQKEFATSKYTRYLLITCKMLGKPVRTVNKNAELKDYENKVKPSKADKPKAKRAPIIGIVGKNAPDFDDKDNQLNHSTYMTVKKGLISAFNTHECTPIIIMSNQAGDPVKNYVENEWRSRTPSLEEQERLIQQIEMCDFVFIQGGVEGEAYECWVAEYCHKHNIPCAGVCEGAYCLIRALDGKIFRLAEGKTAEETKQIKQKHDSVISGVRNAHTAKAVAGSTIEKLVGNEPFMVNSWHGRCMKEEGIASTSMGVEAYDDEGHVEICADNSRTMYLGIQFHPEVDYKTNKVSALLINRIIETAKKNMIKNEKLRKKNVKHCAGGIIA